MSFAFTLPPAPASLLASFSLTVRILVAAVMGRTGAGVMTDALVRLICGRIIDAQARVIRLVEALRAGTLRTRRSPAPGLTRRSAVRATGELGLPRGFGWLLPLVPPHAAVAGSHLQGFLSDPEIAGLLAASPRLVRAVRPLCRMLGVATPKVAAPELPSSAESDVGCADAGPEAAGGFAWSGVPEAARDGASGHEAIDCEVMSKKSA